MIFTRHCFPKVLNNFHLDSREEDVVANRIFDSTVWIVKRSPLKLIFIVILCLIGVKSTTWGWRPAPAYPVSPSSEQEETARDLRKIVFHLSVDIGNRNYTDYEKLDHAAVYLLQEFSQIGYPTQVIPYAVTGRSYKNVIAEKTANPPTLRTIIVGAHYDTCFNPGADDNASGVAGLLLLARMLKGIDLKANVRFAAFVNEEPPFFKTSKMGSWVYAASLRQKEDPIEAVLILEMIGYFSEKPFSQRYLPFAGPFYLHQGNFIAVVGNFPSRFLVTSIVQSFRAQQTFPIASLIAPGFIPAVNYSDHWSFWKEGFPAVMITDTAFLRNPHYHRSTDLPETLDYTKMAQVVMGLRDSIHRLAAP